MYPRRWTRCGHVGPHVKPPCDFITRGRRQNAANNEPWKTHEHCHTAVLRSLAGSGFSCRPFSTQCSCGRYTYGPGVGRHPNAKAKTASTPRPDDIRRPRADANECMAWGGGREFVKITESPTAARMNAKIVTCFRYSLAFYTTTLKPQKRVRIKNRKCNVLLKQHHMIL